MAVVMCERLCLKRHILRSVLGLLVCARGLLAVRQAHQPQAEIVLVEWFSVIVIGSKVQTNNHEPSTRNAVTSQKATAFGGCSLYIL